MYDIVFFDYVNGMYFIIYWQVPLSLSLSLYGYFSEGFIQKSYLWTWIKQQFSNCWFFSTMTKSNKAKLNKSAKEEIINKYWVTTYDMFNIIKMFELKFRFYYYKITGCYYEYTQYLRLDDRDASFLTLYPAVRGIILQN